MGFRSCSNAADSEASRAARFDRLVCARRPMCGKIVDHDNILALKRQDQASFDIGQELDVGH